MTISLQRLTVEPGLDRLISDFFQRSVGEWLSERRYFTLPDGKVQEVEKEQHVPSLKHYYTIQVNLSVSQCFGQYP